MREGEKDKERGVTEGESEEHDSIFLYLLVLFGSLIDSLTPSHTGESGPFSFNLLITTPNSFRNILLGPSRNNALSSDLSIRWPSQVDTLAIIECPSFSFYSWLSFCR